jgi:chromosome segregation ATPase
MVLTMDEPLTETFKEVDGTININTESGSYQPSPSVKLKLYSDIATEADSFYPRLIEIEKEVEDLSTKTDVESFEEEIESIRAKIMNTQDLYNNGQLESAYGMYNGIGTELEELKKQVEERESELKEGKRTVIRTVIIIGIIIVVVIVGYKVYKSVRGNMEYGWLYDKWKNR